MGKGKLSNEKRAELLEEQKELGVEMLKYFFKCRRTYHEYFVRAMQVENMLYADRKARAKK